MELVAYFSPTGTTKRTAEELAKIKSVYFFKLMPILWAIKHTFQNW